MEVADGRGKKLEVNGPLSGGSPSATIELKGAEFVKY